MNERERQLLQDFGRALSDAIAEHPDAAGALRSLRRRGYTLHLMLKEGEEQRAVSGTSRQEVRRELDERAAGDARRRREPEPTFRIDRADLRFLRSIGIDPTRRLRHGRGA